MLLMLAVAAWLYRDRLEAMYRRYAGGPSAAESGARGWEELTAEKAARGRGAVASLSRQGGPAFVHLSAGEAASYIFLEAAGQLPSSSQDVRATVSGDQLVVRADVALRELGGSEALGPLIGLIKERDSVRLAGTIDVIRPGTGQFRVAELKIGSFALPSAIVPRLVARMRRGQMPEGIADDGLPMTLPPSIGDVRIGSGRITVYRNSQ